MIRGPSRILAINFVGTDNQRSIGMIKCSSVVCNCNFNPDDNASTAEIQTYVKEDCLMDSGTKAAASGSALATNTTIKMAPRTIWTAMSVYVRLMRELTSRVVLSPMIT